MNEPGEPAARFDQAGLAGGVPASFAQARIWVMEQVDRGRSSYNVPVPVRLRGPLDVSALAGALGDVVYRHEILRTTYRETADQLIQVVRPPAAPPLPLTDLSRLDPGERRRGVAEALAHAETTPFDLISGPVLRARLLRLGPQEHVLVCAVHHIALDARSLRLLYRDLAEAYAVRAQGGQPAVSGAPRYTDYAIGQRTRLTDERRADLAAFWRGYLDGLTPLDFPQGRPAAVSAGSAGGFCATTLPASLLDRAGRLARATGATLYDVLAAALAALLSRYTGQDDIAIGTSADDRDWSAGDHLVGPCTNTVVLRLNLSGEPTFSELLDRTAESARLALDHADLPFEQVVAAVGGERHAGRNPLFQVYLGLDDSGQALPPFGAVTADAMVPDFSTAKFDLGFGVHTGDDEPVLDSGFATALFDQPAVTRMFGHLRTLLAAALDDPDRVVSRLPILTAAERTEIVLRWNDTGRPYPADRGLHQLFEERAMRQPAATALVCGAAAVGYGDLDARADQLAAQLRALGVGPDRVVGVRLRRGVQQAVAVLATLKAGGAFLPLDPDYPAERLEFMIADSGAVAVLTEPGLAPVAMPGRTAVLHLPPDTQQFGSHSGRGEPRHGQADGVETRGGEIDPARLAYVIYTSGSTGQPKGVAIQHRGAVNNFTDFNDRFRVGPGDTLLAVSSPSFDMSVYDLLGTLAAGATVVLPEPGEEREPGRWLALMRRHRVTIWHSAPALLELLLDHASDGAGLPDLRLALLGGDWIAVGLPDRLRAVAAGVEVISLGGATEASMDSIIFPVGEVDPAWPSIPYGRPMANQRAYILDRHGQPVPPGVPGELHLAGAGLARGYLNQPELTAQRFFSAELCGLKSERLYQTGDLARYRPDGVIELLGRVDFQVKIRGLRIELGEVEAALQRHAAVREAVVVARGERGQHMLAGFLVLSGAVRYDEAELRESLARVLPAHMVPALLTPIEAFPTTPNGKVDRQALASRPAVPQAASAPPAAPEALDDLQQRVADAWCEVLGVTHIGLDEDFFQLGGDSFAAVRAMYSLDRSLPVVELFRNPTVRRLADALRGSADRAVGILCELTPAGRAAELSLVCVPFGGGNAVAIQPLADALPDRIALWAVSLPGHDPSSLDATPLPFKDAVARVVAEVLAKIGGPIAVYGHCAGAWLAIDVARELEERGADLRAVYMGAALPHPDPEGSLRETETTSDEQWAEFLRSIGGFDGPLDWSQAQHILRAGRHTHIGAMEFQRDSYRHPPRQLNVPLHAMFGSADPALPNYATDVQDWTWYAGSVELAVIPGGGHYFVGSHARDVAALIDATHPACTVPASHIADQPPGAPAAVTPQATATVTGRGGRAPVPVGAEEE